MNEIEQPIHGHSRAHGNQSLPYNELQEFLNNVQVPDIKPHPKTFLGIARQPHYENVLSNLLAFYFDVNGIHGLHSLFIDTFFEMIKEKASEDGRLNINEILLDFHEGFKIFTENPTKGGGYIDILLESDSSFIVIENKVYHTLVNDLNDYWDSAVDSKKNGAMAGVGVVLSLYGVSDIPHRDFMNITHHEFLKRVMKNIGPYLLGCNEKYLVFLKDMYQNIINLSQALMNEIDVEFYFQNQVHINQLVKFNQAVHKHIINEVEKAGHTIEGVDLISPRSTNSNSKRLRYFRSKVNNDINVAIVFENIRAEGNFYMIIEVVGGLLKQFRLSNPLETSIVLSEDAQEVDREEIRKNLVKVESDGKTWAHVYRHSYTVSPKEVHNLAEFIQDKFKKDHFRVVLNAVERHWLSTRQVVPKNVV